MHISPLSKTSIRTKFFNNKDKEKEKEKEKVKDKKDIEKKSLSKILYSQKKYIKMISTQKLISRNIDYIKKNSYKVMLRNKSNMEQTIKIASNENSVNKNDDNFNLTKNIINYNSEIYTPKHSKHNSTTNVINKSKKENNNINIANISQQKQINLINNARKTNLFIKNLINKEPSKGKTENIVKNKIFSFPVSPKNNNKNNGNLYSKHDNDYNKSKMVKSFILSKKPEIPLKNFSSSSSLNIFNNNNNIHNNHEQNKDSNINSHSNSNSKKYKNKNKGNFNVINFNNKNLGAYLKKIYFNNSKLNKENNEKTNRNNNYILINHLLLNDINITGNNNGNIINDSLNLTKYKPKTSRNDKNMKNSAYKDKIYSLNNENHYNNNFINGDNYINMSDTNCENLDIRTKMEIYKNIFKDDNSPEENHFNTIYFLQKMKLYNHNIK
jgi:hypothetical protein